MTGTQTLTMKTYGKDVDIEMFISTFAEMYGIKDINSLMYEIEHVDKRTGRFTKTKNGVDTFIYFNITNDYIMLSRECKCDAVDVLFYDGKVLL